MYIYITEDYLVQFLRIFTATETLHERRFHSKINFRYKNKSLKQQLPDENQGDLLISHHHHQELNWWVKLVQLRGFSFVVIPPFFCEKLKKKLQCHLKTRIFHFVPSISGFQFAREHWLWRFKTIHTIFHCVKLDIIFSICLLVFFIQIGRLIFFYFWNVCANVLEATSLKL